MTDSISPICGTYLGAPQTCNVEAVTAVATGTRATSTGETYTPTPSVLALVFVLACACVVMSIPTRRNGRRAK